MIPCDMVITFRLARRGVDYLVPGWTASDRRNEGVSIWSSVIPWRRWLSSFSFVRAAASSALRNPVAMRVSRTVSPISGSRTTPKMTLAFLSTAVRMASAARLTSKRERAAAGDVQQHAGGAFHRYVEQGTGQCLPGGGNGTVRAGRPVSAQEICPDTSSIAST